MDLVDTRHGPVTKPKTSVDLEGGSVVYSAFDSKGVAQVWARGGDPNAPPRMVSLTPFGYLARIMPVSSSSWYTVFSGVHNTWYTIGGFTVVKSYETYCSPSSIRVRYPGTYVVEFQLNGAVSGTAKADYDIALVVNGAAPAASPSDYTRPGTEITGNVPDIGLRANHTFIIDLNANDKIEMKMRVTNNAPTNFDVYMMHGRLSATMM